MDLHEYAQKRRFPGTPEPDGIPAPRKRGQRRPIFVVQLHHARARHYDFRLEVDGVLKSWAVPKGPSLRAGEKRLAVQVEDHPLSYASFQGDIPKGHYGAGHVAVFDHGVWSGQGDPLEALAAGKLDFTLEGSKLHGAWKLVRTGTAKSGTKRQPQWLLIKRTDPFAADVEADDLIDTVATADPQAKRRAPSRQKRAGKKTKSAATQSHAQWTRRAAALPGAVPGALAGFKPELATLRQQAPSGDDWLHEVKWDGYRMLTDIVGGVVRLRSRNDLDWTGDFPDIVAALEALPIADAHVDGELVALGKNGISDFALLQHVLQGRDVASLRYVVFDLPGLAGYDLGRAPLLSRKELLKDLIATSPNGPLQFSQHVIGHGGEVFAASGKQGLEGILSKRIDSQYVQARSHDWIKVKHAQSDEFVIVGYSAPVGSRKRFGALLTATRDESGQLRYSGRIGTGFRDEDLQSLWKKMQPLRRQTPTIALPSHLPHDKRDRGNITWIDPRLVIEAAYRGFGKDGLLRQASFQRLRIDKVAKEIAMPANSSPVKTTRARASATVAISSRDRIVFPDSGVTKGDVADYYEQIADRILPWIAERPLSLMRCPGGIASECFFQKHHANALGNDVRSISLHQKSGVEDYLYIKNAAGLMELVQMNTLEFHPWGSRIDKPELPDMLVFDLDPDPGIGWKEVVDAARDVREHLRAARLESFVRLSGGKGLHVVVPIRRGPDWETVRNFTGAFAEAMAASQPLRYVATMSKARRKGRIFIDWLRNGRGATSVCNWSLRARKGAPVAMPIRWEELGRTAGPDAYDLKKALRRARTMKEDPWADFGSLKQSLPG
ncbi:DNA ligase D [Solilutibacter silvestris]|uniref:DNA ligase (ATP) n=1 Tax=Solilutibacter silvestris TaxID=1645665 RepID=A0A2K1Q3B8_9GAMM|nr:DNA ligase D [Lysobacter silvestris]PNS09503.1 DNA ligase D [Lysobacter silvestris]